MLVPRMRITQRTRCRLFEIELSKRSSSELIDCEKLSAKTADYSSADIKLVVDTAARIVFRNKASEITENDIILALQTVKPSLSKAVIAAHLKIRDEFENPDADEAQKSIGFRGRFLRKPKPENRLFRKCEH